MPTAPRDACRGPVIISIVGRENELRSHLSKPIRQLDETHLYYSMQRVHAEVSGIQPNIQQDSFSSKLSAYGTTLDASRTKFQQGLSVELD
jgi:hypothetical protein